MNVGQFTTPSIFVCNRSAKLHMTLIGVAS